MEIHVRDKGVFVVDDKTLDLVGTYDEVPDEVFEIIEAVRGSKGARPSSPAEADGAPPKRKRGRPPKKAVLSEEDKPILVTGSKIETDPSEEVIKQAIASGVV